MTTPADTPVEITMETLESGAQQLCVHLADGTVLLTDLPAALTVAATAETAAIREEILEWLDGILADPRRLH